MKIQDKILRNINKLQKIHDVSFHDRKNGLFQFNRPIMKSVNYLYAVLAKN